MAKKEMILKEIEEFKNSKNAIIKGKHASPNDLMKLLKIVDVKIEQQQLKMILW